MKLLRRTGRGSGPSLDDRLTALAEAAELADGRLDAGAVARARAVVDRAGARRSLSVDHTAVALAGATGSGKSSLFNLLSGTSLARVGVTRPTTSTAQAALWDGAGSGPLLDWLQIPDRHEVDGTAEHRTAGAARDGTGYGGESGARDGAGSGARDGAGDAGLSGLVLLDLPDHDSIERAHRLEVDRLAGLVDLLVWVLDPQKYADAAVHDLYLAPLARHRDVTVVVLNQIDRLSPAAAERCLADLRRLLEADGLAGVPVLGVSARTGAGVGELRALLAARVAGRRSWTDRLAADAETAADALARASTGSGTSTGTGSGTSTGTGSGTGASTGTGSGIGGSTGSGGAAGGTGARGTGGPAPVGGATGPVRTPDADAGVLAGPLAAALSQAAGVPVVVRAVAKAHRHRSVAATGWPVTRWARRLRPDPLRRLRLGGGSPGPDAVGEAVGRTSIPAAGAVQRSQLDTALRDTAAVASAGLSEPWAAAVRRAARSHADELEDALDRAVATTSLGASRRPLWWRVAGAAQWLVLAAAVAGALWLLGLFAMDYLHLPEPPVPTAGELPWPTLLLLGGLLLGVVLALLSRAVAWLGGRRRARKAAGALRASVERVGRELVLDPVQDELTRHRRFTEAVATARRGA
ncbi:50S ribosome-binding GTPase [Planomonospora sp. ID91781]|uniref:GTPase n=1 Tax=Planomonospora sp. ID91781 TaxID=2738135 RepID=UPI001A32A017|nr:GTPase [Planomonospora sp. ID91781]MBG0819468.1 50S ribosome-binding GTPase [Planomonospora sp. ID91781]